MTKFETQGRHGGLPCCPSCSRLFNLLIRPATRARACGFHDEEGEILDVVHLDHLAANGSGHKPVLLPPVLSAELAILASGLPVHVIALRLHISPAAARTRLWRFRQHQAVRLRA